MSICQHMQQPRAMVHCCAAFILLAAVACCKSFPPMLPLHLAKTNPAACLLRLHHPPCRGVWRNGLLFSPTTKYGDYSFMDLMIRPMAEAMRDSLAAASKAGKLVTPPDRARPVVYMALTGESHTAMTWQRHKACILSDVAWCGLPVSCFPSSRLAARSSSCYHR